MNVSARSCMNGLHPLVVNDQDKAYIASQPFPSLERYLQYPSAAPNKAYLCFPTSLQSATPNKAYLALLPARCWESRFRILNLRGHLQHSPQSINMYVSRTGFVPGYRYIFFGCMLQIVIMTKVLSLRNWIVQRQSVKTDIQHLSAIWSNICRLRFTNSQQNRWGRRLQVAGCSWSRCACPIHQIMRLPSTSNHAKANPLTVVAHVQRAMTFQKEQSLFFIIIHWPRDATVSLLGLRQTCLSLVFCARSNRGFACLSAHNVHFFSTWNLLCVTNCNYISVITDNVVVEICCNVTLDTLLKSIISSCLDGWIHFGA